ncbi:MAG: hypothetical protein IKO19_06395 [Candidatus Riflebacteria bacterium]|nr:hypothetical protein [Candidatus Riflebacteria bacterium]
MKFSKGALACFMFLLASGGIKACELPAHPSAIAMPLNTENLKLVQTNNGFYYLVPEGSEVQMKIVWDPYCHNAGSGVKQEEYEGVVKENIPFDKDIPAVNERGFFPLTAMSDFFVLRGNRKDLSEAFGREKDVNGSALGSKFIGDEGLGPEAAFAVMFSKIDDLKLKIDGSSNDYESINGLSDQLPSKLLEKRVFVDSNNSGSNDVFIMEGGKAKLVNKKGSSESLFSCAANDDFSKIKIYSDCGISLEKMEIVLRQPKPKEYKAFLVQTEKTDRIQVNGISYTEPSSTDDSYPASGEKFTVKFTTPSIMAKDGSTDVDSKNSIIKMKVNSPAAGYDLKNLKWVWVENIYERKTKGKVELKGVAGSTEVIEEDGVKKIDCSNNDIYVYEKTDSKKSDKGITLLFAKGSQGTCYSAYMVYDNKGPISSKLTISSSSNGALQYKENNQEYNNFDKDLTTTFNFVIEVLDTNPYFDSEFKLNEKISQDKSKMNLTFFYNYPVYNYKVEDKINLNNLNGYGLVDLASDNNTGYKPEFKSYKHTVDWHWKKVSGDKVVINKITRTDKIKANDGEEGLVGSVAKIEGTFTIDSPKPWHVTDAEMENMFSVFALFNDTAGKSHITDAVKASEGKAESANPANLKDENYAVYPNETVSCKEIKSNSELENFDLLTTNWSDKDYWQTINRLSSKDNTAPEIQVIVLDTRTNRYHVFGSAKYTPAGLIQSGKANDDYRKLDFENVPFINKNDGIEKQYLYNDFNNISTLYDTYLKGPDAVSELYNYISSKPNTGFVCQKNSRLVFYPRAIDNINYMKSDDKFGISTMDIKLFDYEGKEISINTTSTDRSFENVFRQENYDKDGNLKAGMQPYKLIITAEDKANPVNKRVFELDIAVLGRTLDIRTLEEKRERVD